MQELHGKPSTLPASQSPIAIGSPSSSVRETESAMRPIDSSTADRTHHSSIAPPQIPSATEWVKTLVHVSDSSSFVRRLRPQQHLDLRTEITTIFQLPDKTARNPSISRLGNPEHVRIPVQLRRPRRHETLNLLINGTAPKTIHIFEPGPPLPQNSTQPPPEELLPFFKRKTRKIVKTIPPDHINIKKLHPTNKFPCIKITQPVIDHLNLISTLFALTPFGDIISIVHFAPVTLLELEPFLKFILTPSFLVRV